MRNSLRRLLISATFAGAALYLAQPAQAQFSCVYEWGYCNGAGGSMDVQGPCPWWPYGGMAYFQCNDAQGLIYDGCCAF